MSELTRWLRLQELFDRAAMLDAADVAAFLEREEPDPGMRAEVQALLRADRGEDALEGIVGRIADHAQLDNLESGTRVGPWRLLDELGAGGMGTVFRAERADGAYERLVAIKFLRGLPTRDAAERMRRERQILADLDHPNIAGLIDGGTTADGQPYLVMDYVEGVSIVEFARGCDIDRRLRLVADVARALHFAHQHLVVHRDLKPANILVRNDGTPMLLDFGIAKLLEADAGDDPGRTQAWFTPGYASPEQRRGDPVSTASDIYALGQVLAEVLTGVYRAPDADGLVTLPGQRGLKGLPKPRLRELDAMVAQACAPRRAARYRSAEALADDIDRYFQHKPLRAAPARPGYLLRSFLHRHRLAVAAVAVFLLAIATFAWRLVIERDRALQAEALAQANATTAEQVVDYLVSLFEAASPEQAGNQAILPGDLVDRGRERIRGQLVDQPQQRARLLAVLGRIDSELGRTAEAVQSLREAIAIEREVGTPAHVVDHYVSIGVLENQNERPEEATTAFTEALSLIQAGQGNAAQQAKALGGLALAQLRMGQGDEARASAAEALRLAERVQGPDSELAVEALQVVAEVDSRTGRGEAAVAAASRALAIVRTWGAGHAQDVATAIGFLANTHVQQDEYAQAIPLLREMLAMRLESLAPDSAWVITARHNLAHALYLGGSTLEALPYMQENVDLLRARGEDDTPSYLVAINNIASLHEATGNYGRSIPLFRELYEKALAASAVSLEPRLYQYRQNYGRSLMLAGRLDEARPLLWAEVPSAADPQTNALERGRRLLHMGEWLRRSGRFEEVEAHLVQAEGVFATILEKGHPRFAAVLRVRAQVALDRGQPAQAVPMLREVVDVLEGTIGADAPATMEARALLARALYESGAQQEARSLLAAGFEALEQRFVPQAPIRDELAQLRQRLRG